MTALRRGFRALGSRLIDPLEDALRLARTGWDRRTAANRAAPPDRTFPLHVIRACVSWVTRLALDRDANRAITRCVRKLGKLAVRWKRRAPSLTERYEDEQGRRDELNAHREKHGSAIQRIAIALVLGAAMVVLLAVVDLSIGESGMEMLLDNPAQTVLGVKLVSLAAWGFVLMVAVVTKVSASALRRVISGEEWRANLVKLAVCAVLVSGFVVALAGPRQDAVQSGSGGTKSGAKTSGQALAKYAKPGGRDEEFPWLLVVLGLSPFALGTVLLAFTQNTPAEKDTRLWAVHCWSGWRRRGSERRFGRVLIAVDRTERRLVDIYLRLRRELGEEEAARILHAVGYRLGEEWSGYLAEVPKLIKRIEDADPGALPSWDSDYLTRMVATPDRVVDGGPIRQKFERFGNPLAEHAEAVHVQHMAASKASQNGKGPRKPAIKKTKK